MNYLVDKFKELSEEDQSGFREEVSGGQRVIGFLTFPLRLVWAFGFFLVMW